MRLELVMPNAEHFNAGLRQLPARLAKKAVSQSLRAGAKIIQDEAKRLVPVDTGALRKSIRVRAGKVRGLGEVKIIITTSGQDNVFTGDQYYGAFIEFGHRIGKASKVERRLIRAKSRTKDEGRKAEFAAALDRISTRKLLPARPFMRQAFDHKKDEAIAAIGVVLGQAIDNEWRRLMA